MSDKSSLVWPEVPCAKCSIPVNLETDPYRKVVDMKGTARYWHKRPCWYGTQTPAGPSLQLGASHGERVL
ncbi:MAG TPA: hypothetical protein VMV62_00340 [Candidatus Paceibacterota bacterium]|nr:hypothetical protein [Candidatus Paceibacterota bacterium]